MNKTIIGIDPGLYGSIVLCHRNRLEAYYAMPKEVTTVNIYALHKILLELLKQSSGVIILEDIINMPGQHAKASGTTAKNWGIVYALSMLLAKHVITIHPGVWTRATHGKYLGRECFEGTSKARSAKCFKQVYGKYPWGRMNKLIETGIIDAALMCDYYYNQKDKEDVELL